MKIFHIFASLHLLVGLGLSQVPQPPTTQNGQDPVHEQTEQSESDSGNNSNSLLTLQFGVYRTDKASTLYKSFLPIIIGLQDGIEAELKRPVEIEIKIFKTYQEGLDSLVNGTVDFVRFGPASYVLAKDRDKEIQLLGMEHKEGKKEFSGVIVVSAESPIQELEDLKGSRFAFGDKNSTIGRYLAQAEMIKAGVVGSDLSTYEFLGRHDLVAKAVEIGDFDAGSLKISTFLKMNRKGKLRILWSFDNVTKPWIAKSTLDPKVVAAMSKVLLKWQDKAALRDLNISGWLACSDKEYKSIRESMKLAEMGF